MLKKRYSLRKQNTKNFRLLKEFDNHEMVIGLTDEKVGLRGYIAIHSTDLGPALGGTRWQHYPSEEAALRDVLNLSKAMSYKCALAGLPWGGGKAVLLADPILDKDAVLAAYARMVEKLNGLFKTGTDMGILDAEVKRMARHTSHMLGVSRADRGDLTTSKMAALGVYYCIRACLAEVFGDDSPEGKVIGVKGVGKLGGELVRLLHDDGAKLVIADVDPAKIRTITRKYPDIEVADPKTVHELPLDVYAPCALGGELTLRTIKELNTKIIAGGANNQLASAQVGDKLFQAGVTYAPDYITNAGGLIYVADELEPDGFHKDRVLQRVKEIQKTLAEVLETSKKRKIATHRIADEVSLARMSKGD